MPTIINGSTGIDKVQESAAYQKSNILGTVSQAGGVPTGAIMERGSNANGNYVKYADGTLICFVNIPPTNAATMTATGTFTSYYKNYANVPLPATFLNTDYVVSSKSLSPYHDLHMAGSPNNSTTTFNQVVTCVRSEGLAFNFVATITGRWY